MYFNIFAPTVTSKKNSNNMELNAYNRNTFFCLQVDRPITGEGGLHPGFYGISVSGLIEEVLQPRT